MELRLEVVVVPVSGVDRAEAFHRDRAGFVVDHDTRISDTSGWSGSPRPGRRARS